MIQQLTPQGVIFPTVCYHRLRLSLLYQICRIEDQLRQLFADLDVENVSNLQKCGKQARSLILNTAFPQELQEAIASAYQALCERYGDETEVAVRSSATAEDLPDASFAGQQETYLNVQGIKRVLEYCHRCYASLFTDRAISYRQHNGFDHFEVALSVGVQKMVRSDLASSGVMFSIDTETGFKNVALITAAYGLGETVVQGAVNPDEFFVFKPTLTDEFRPILEKRLGTKEIKMVYDVGSSRLTKNVGVPLSEREQFCITDQEILQLARWAVQIENHYSTVRNVETPMDIEWAKDGITGELFIVQARPETVQSQKSTTVLKSYQIQQQSDILITGRSVGAAIGQGKARVILDASQINLFQPGEVLVTIEPILTGNRL
jgi:pyruvate,water dikinase